MFSIGRIWYLFGSHSPMEQLGYRGKSGKITSGDWPKPYRSHCSCSQLRIRGVTKYALFGTLGVTAIPGEAC